MLVVADTSPINYLILVQHELLLPTLYTRVVIPPAVSRACYEPWSADIPCAQGMVIPADAGIQGVPLGWIPACAGMTCTLTFPLCILVWRATVKMHNTL